MGQETKRCDCYPCRLARAAPALLAACEAVAEDLKSDGFFRESTLKNLHAAIAAARGAEGTAE
jgi:hypothetical protein